MGQEIVYCFKCQRRIVGTEFAEGKAFQARVDALQNSKYRGRREPGPGALPGAERWGGLCLAGVDAGPQAFAGRRPVGGVPAGVLRLDDRPRLALVLLCHES